MHPLSKIARLAAISWLASSLSACGGAPPIEHAEVEEVAEEPPAAVEPANRDLLDAVEAADSWFHAKKTKAIWARQVSEDQTVETLEGSEEVSAGDYLCRGEAGEIWPQSGEKLDQKYAATDQVDGDGWRRYTPRPDAVGVLAAQVDRPFTVEATWGTLTGKAGDFVVKSYDDRDQDYPEDVWIVDQDLFAATYARVEPSEG